MRLEYLPQADADLETIIAHFSATTPELLANVLEDIEQALDRICEFPNAYPRQPGRPYRIHVTRKYRFRVVYLVFEDRVEVLGVFRFRNRQS